MSLLYRVFGVPRNFEEGKKVQVRVGQDFEVSERSFAMNHRMSLKIDNENIEHFRKRVVGMHDARELIRQQQLDAISTTFNKGVEAVELLESNGLEASLVSTYYEHELRAAGITEKELKKAGLEMHKHLML